MRYKSNAEYAASSAFAWQRAEELQKIVIELAAAIVRLDRNGYQERLLERALKDAAIPRDKVDEFNRERAARIARKQASQ